MKINYRGNKTYSFLVEAEDANDVRILTEFLECLKGHSGRFIALESVDFTDYYKGFGFCIRQVKPRKKPWYRRLF